MSNFAGRVQKNVVLMLTALLILPACTTDGTPTPTSKSNNTGPVPANTGWSYKGASDPAAPDLLVSSTPTGAVRIKADWDVQAIEYMDSWWGLGKPGLTNKVINRSDSSYKLEGKDVPADQVQALVRALDHLQPAQMMMTYHSHTDDYPSWTVQITGNDHQYVLLFASSTGNPGNGPWSVLYNGRLYAQYDGSVASAIGALFGGRLSSPDSSSGQGPLPTGTLGTPIPLSNDVQFSTGGLPNQLVSGFTGLLAVSGGFSYVANLEKGEIEGQLTGSSRIGSMQQGKIKNLNSLQITTSSGTVSCETKLLPEGDPFTPVTAWSFTCPVNNAKAGDNYHYPIAATLGLLDGSKVDVSGDLWGTWQSADQQHYTLLPPPHELQNAISKSLKAQDLLTDHLLGASDYTAELPSSDPLRGTRNGEAILFGQTTVGGKPVRYTVGTQFIIQDGALSYWDLDRAGLNSMLQAVMSQPLTTRVLAADPNTIINLWYATGTPKKENTFDSYAQAYSAQVNPCGAVPGGQFPSAGKPLVAVGYNTSPYFAGRAPFVLIDNKQVAADVAIQPGADVVQAALVPGALGTGGSKPFSAIYMDIAPYGGGGPTLHITEPKDTQAGEKSVYDAKLKALPAQTSVGDQGDITVRNVTLAVDTEGKLQVVSCAAPTPTPIEAQGGGGTNSNSRPPYLAYTTFYGGTRNGDGSTDTGQSTSANSVALDSQGNAYIVGATSANDIPLKNPSRTQFSADLWAGFVAKFGPNGSNLLFGSYVGSGTETAIYGFTVDVQGNMYMTGSAREGFEVANSPIQTTLHGDADAFVMKLGPDGKVIFSTYLGGSGYDVGNRIAVDKQGNIYIAGSTRSSDFPLEKPLQAQYKGKGPKDHNGDAFVAKIAADGSKLIYSTYLGGSGGDPSTGLTVDPNGDAYVVGSTDSIDFPMSHPLQSKMQGQGSAYISKLSPDGQSLLYSTYFGEGTWALDVALDSSDNIYVAGSTSSANLRLVKPLYATFNGGVLFSKDPNGPSDGFLAKLSADGSAVLFSTFLGGSGADSAISIGFDAKGNVYVGGSTTSPDLPTVRPLQKEYSDQAIGLAPDSFVVKLSSDLSQVLYSTYFGADGFDSMSGMAVDAQGNVYLAGEIDGNEKDFPMAGKPFQSSNEGIRNAFVSKIADDQP